MNHYYNNRLHNLVFFNSKNYFTINNQNDIINIYYLNYIKYSYLLKKY